MKKIRNCRVILILFKPKKKKIAILANNINKWATQPKQLNDEMK